MSEGFAALLINHSVSLVVEVVLVAVSLLLLIPCAVIFIECFAANLPDRQSEAVFVLPQPKIAVLMPAHDEAAVIGATLATLMPQLLPQDCLIVIADNCSDGTAAIARSMGATVVERRDLGRQGKGYALDFGLQALAADPPDVVVVVDADCSVVNGTLQKISRLAALKSRPVQATYLLAQPDVLKPKDAISVLAFTVKNLVRPLGLHHLGLPCLLTGTGMAFPWSALSHVSLASGNIVEDMKLALDLAIAGYSPIFCRDAEVTGVLPQQVQATKSQRKRWEHGHLTTLITQVPRLVRESLRQKRFDLLAIALDLCVPPLSLLVMLWVAALAVSFFYFSLTGAQVPLILLVTEGLLILVSIASAWANFARNDLPLETLLSVPLYILWKIPLYLAFLIKPQTKWVRTERDATGPSEL